MKRAYAVPDNIESFNELEYSRKKQERDYCDLDWGIRLDSFLAQNFLFDYESETRLYDRFIRYNYQENGKWRSGSLVELLKSNNNQNILIVFYNPHFNFLDILKSILFSLENNLFIIIATCSEIKAVESNDFPNVHNGKNLIKRLKIVDPLGGGSYPSDCCFLITSHGDLKDFIMFRNCNTQQLKLRLSIPTN